MINTKKIYEARLIVTENTKYETERISSFADAVKVCLCARAEKGLTFSIVRYDKELNAKTVYTKELSADAEGKVELEHSFDPVYLFVYESAHSFAFVIEGASEITELDVYEGANENVQSEAVSRDNTGIDKDGKPVVYVKLLNGERAEVPRIPRKVLFAGNSLLLGIGYGMCSSAPDKDYYHYVTEHILSFNPDCKFGKLPGSIFERCESIEAFENWYNDHVLPQLSDDTDLIILQHGDNIGDEVKVLNFTKTKDLFIEKLKRDIPYARIIWVHGWYNKRLSGPYVEEVCNKWDIECIDISSIRCRETEAHHQTEYFDVSEGKIKAVDKAWQTHPGDLGMKRIADSIIATLKLEK